MLILKKTPWGVIAVLVVVGLFLAVQAFSQPGRRGGQQGPGGQFDPERIRQMMEQRLQETLGATDQEWTLLRPRVMKVSELNQDLQSGARGLMMLLGSGGFGGGPGGRLGQFLGANRFDGQELSDVQKIQQELKKTLENTSSTSEQLKKQLTKLRSAKEKTKQELAKAQQELRQIVTIRQEAMLVLMGILN